MDSQCLFYSLMYFHFNKKSGLVVNGTVFTASPILKNNNKHNLEIYAHFLKHILFPSHFVTGISIGFYCMVHFLEFPREIVRGK